MKKDFMYASEYNKILPKYKYNDDLKQLFDTTIKYGYGFISVNQYSDSMYIKVNDNGWLESRYIGDAYDNYRKYKGYNKEKLNNMLEDYIEYLKNKKDIEYYADKISDDILPKEKDFISDFIIKHKKLA